MTDRPQTPATNLPVASVLDDLRAALRRTNSAVLAAPPGAGKTTLVPLALLDETWLGGGRIVVLEPRRLAARMAARRMASLHGDALGETVGYRVRLDSRVGPRTRIEVVTEGILTRRLIDDPELSGVAAVVFDEFHERNIHSDLGLALCLEAQAALRDDLRILVMSATLDAGRIAGLLGGAPQIVCAGRLFPVAVRHLPRPPPDDLAPAVAAAVREAVAAAAGSVLAFLPGEREIRRVQGLLETDLGGAEAMIAPLHGGLPVAAQDAAVRPPPAGTRKIVLATDIAETSLTIEDVRMVVDCGYRRTPRFDAASGMTRLETRRISQAAAEQRRGRAGRTGPGVCYRLWPEAETAALSAFETPEILQADLAPLMLDLARWGVADPARLTWLDPPPAAGCAQARELLHELGAVDATGRLSSHGAAMADLPMHPRLAHMLLRGTEDGHGALACDIAALLEERDIADPERRDADLRSRLEILHARAGDDAQRGAVRRVRAAAADLRRRMGVPAAQRNPAAAAGSLLALAYPDRVARRRAAGGRYLLRNGRGARLPDGDALQAEEWLAVGPLGGKQADARIFLAAPLAAAEVTTLFGDDIAGEDSIAWDARRERVVAVYRTRLGAITLAERRLPDAPGGAVAAAMLDGVRHLGLDALPWSDALRQWQARVLFLRGLAWRGLPWPDVGDAWLAAHLETWLEPYLAGIGSRRDLARLDLRAALSSLLDRRLAKALDEGAPAHVTAPTGSRIALDYLAPDGPVLRVRLQEMLGVPRTPAVADGAVPVLVELLSPAGRPIQTTRDLAGFWTGSYAQVRAEMRGRYPKHYWPDDPLAATPTKRSKKAMDRTRRR